MHIFNIIAYHTEKKSQINPKPKILPKNPSFLKHKKQFCSFVVIMSAL